MDYKDLRKKFVELSGRYDLIKSTEEDDGADFIINAAQQNLDRLFSDGKMIARYPVIVTAGQFYARTVDIRAVREVWVANVDGKSLMTPNSLVTLREYYDQESSDITQGVPEYWSPGVFRPAPDTLSSTSGMYDVEDLLLYDATAPAKHFNYNGILFYPPADGTYTISLWGLFYSPTLTATLAASVWTQTKSYWTEVHPMTLVKAALLELEGLYRNTDGAKDFENAMMRDVRGLDYDAVEQDMIGDMQMGG